MATYIWTLTQTSCKVNIENWRVCAANAWQRGDLAEQHRCEEKARKIAGWLHDLIDEPGGV